MEQKENIAYNNSNKIRTILLLIADKEMTTALKNPKLQINSEFPRMINYCKENDFGLTLKQNFCSTRVKYTEDNLKKSKVKVSCKTFYYSKNSKDGLYSPWFINKKYPSKVDLVQNKEKKVTIFEEEHHDVNKTPTIESLKRLNKRNLTKKILIPQFNDLSERSKRDIRTEQELEKSENTRNKAGSYLDDPSIFKKIAKSFKYIRNLPVINKDWSNFHPASAIHLSPDIKRKNEEELEKQREELELSLIMKDGLDADHPNIMKKLSRMRIEANEEGKEGKFSSTKTSLRFNMFKSKNSLNMTDGIEAHLKLKKNSSTNIINIGKLTSLSLFSPEKKEHSRKSSDNEDSFNLRLERIETNNCVNLEMQSYQGTNQSENNFDLDDDMNKIGEDDLYDHKNLNDYLNNSIC